ncbi:MAG: class I SAM-dependent methyltransferase [Candidatus Eremiobacteraeota bacterium]|nr:class I SAM-dependent methyltransferase [Candidatus Eremiobacteraeota bacterium]
MSPRRSSLDARVSGRRAGQRFDADHRVVTEALLFLGDLDPEAIGANIEHATHYEPTPVGELERLLAHVPFPLDRATFVDLGAGMGRALFAAARYPFRQIVGVEISPALAAIARDNLAVLDISEFACRDIRIVRGDASTFRFPKGDLIAYLYNPFDAMLVAKVIATLARGRRTNLALLYHTPVERDVVEAHAAFELCAEEPFGVVYLGSPAHE